VIWQPEDIRAATMKLIIGLAAFFVLAVSFVVQAEQEVAQLTFVFDTNNFYWGEDIIRYGRR
jgi:hypothetical protein